MNMSNFVAGLDLGLMNDFSALCILEVKPEGIMHLRHLQRFRLVTKYWTVCTHVERLLSKLPGTHSLVVDQTGVGRGVTSMFEERAVPFIPVTITAGDKAVRVDGEWRVPKRDLVAGLTVALQNGKLRVAKNLKESNNLVAEMLNFRVKISVSGNDTYGAWRESVHDDLVLSCALAVWYAGKTAGSLGIESLNCPLTFGHVQMGGYEEPDYQHQTIEDVEQYIRDRDGIEER